MILIYHFRLEEAFGEARNDQKFIRADSERIAAVLLGLHQGAQGLLQRVHPYHSLAEGGVFELTQVGEEASPWTETVDALTTAEHVSIIDLFQNWLMLFEV